jgi:tetratricopeptide (TPR) repeat protein
VKSILNGLGIGYFYKANYDKALKYYFESLELRQKDADKFEISVALNNIGLVYSTLEDFDKALLYYKQALHLRREINNNWDLETLLLNISLCYGLKNNFSEARNFAEQGLSFCGKSCNEVALSFGRHIFGLISFGQHNFSEAEAHFLESYALSKKEGEEKFNLANIYYLLRIYIHSNQLPLAEKYLKEAELLIASGIPYNDEIIEIYAQLFTLYYKSKNFEKVAFYQNKYIALKDSIYSKDLTTSLMKVEAEHLEKENKARIEFQSKILTLNEEVIFRQKIVNVSVGMVALLVIILAFVLAKGNRQKRIANRLLDEKVKQRTHQLELNQDALQRAWQERDALINMASIDIKSSIATIKGLCLLGKKDIDHPNAQQYLNKMDRASDHLSEILNRMFYSYKI